ncbi:MAG: hypothetical protein JSS81_00300 [Acidobacteria bacterium]|nr:hypothetical protein [Acidobacteriota bacterium]
MADLRGFLFLGNKTKEKSVKIRVIRVIRSLFFFVPPKSIITLNLFLSLMPLGRDAGAPFG